MRDDRARLLDIQEAIEWTERYTMRGQWSLSNLQDLKRAIAAMLREQP